jgi:hypothetical protein
VADLSIAPIQQITAHMLAAVGSPPASPTQSASPGSSGPPAWLAVVAALATVLSAIAAVWFPVIAGPRYRLWYGPIRWKQRNDGSWEVNLYLSGRGRRDITRKAFDQDKPIAFDIGVPIREVTAASSPPILRIVEHHAEGTCLLVCPGLIGRRQDLRFTIITDHKPQGIVCKESLIDVRVYSTDLSPRIRWLNVSGLITIAYLFIASVAISLLGYYTGINELVQTAVIIIGFVPLGTWIFYRRNFPAPLE